MARIIAGSKRWIRNFQWGRIERVSEPGTYTLTVTATAGSASGSAQQTIQLKLIVN